MDFNVDFRTSDAPIEWVVMDTYKVGRLDWETSVRSDQTNVIYYFRAYTRSGSLRLARKFIRAEEHS